MGMDAEKATARAEEDLGGITLRQLLELQPTAGPEPPVWLPDGSGVVVKAATADGSRISKVDVVSGALQTVTDDPGMLPFLSTSLFSVSPDGRWLSYTGAKDNADGRERSSRVEIWLQALGGGTDLQLTNVGANINAYSWAPDGSSIVFSANRFGRYDIFLVSVPDGATTRLTTDDRYEVYPVFTPDGARIVYVRLNQNWTDHEIVEMQLDGSASSTLTTDKDFFDYHYGRKFGYPLISPQTNAVLFPSHRSGWINYWQVSLSGGTAAPVAPAAADQTEAALSPDGRQVAYIENENGTARLMIASLDNRTTPRSVVAPAMGVVSGPAWSPDGRQIAYLMGTPTCPSNLCVVDVDSGATRQVTHSAAAEQLAGQLLTPQKVSYPSFDGLEISAYLYAPRQPEAGVRYPGLLYIHGGPTSQFMDDYRPDVQYFVRKGYVVLMPNIRGSSGYGKEFEDANNADWGHGDLQDVLAGVEYLRTLDYVNGANMGIHGTSYGGCMSMSAVGFAPGVFKAAVPHAGYGDWLDFEDEQELRHRQLLRYEFGDVKQHRDVYRRCSPIYHLAAATTPVFLVHGEGRYPRSDASLKFARALEQEYKTYEYKVYPNECYYVRSVASLCDMYPDIVAFLDQYLKSGL